jgi:hypothetical protein
MDQWDLKRRPPERDWIDRAGSLLMLVLIAGLILYLGSVWLAGPPQVQQRPLPAPTNIVKSNTQGAHPA